MNTSANEYIKLKERIKKEVKRRIYEGSVEKYGGEEYDFKIVPESGDMILAEHYNKINIPTKAINPMDLPKDVVIGSELEKLDILDAKITLFESKTNISSKDTGCASSCTGFCSSSCTGSCSSGCSNSCLNSCQNSCSGCSGCGSSCSSNCTNSCSGCQNSCSGCSGNCGSSCSSDCYKSCTSSCIGCSSNCNTSCAYDCSGVGRGAGCGNTCAASCEGCFATCGAGCGSMCSSSCSSSSGGYSSSAYELVKNGGGLNEIRDV